MFLSVRAVVIGTRDSLYACVEVQVFSVGLLIFRMQFCDEYLSQEIITLRFIILYLIPYFVMNFRDSWQTLSQYLA